ncbi:MAG: hypothetical protein QNI86_09395 [Halieaceae bacterium]|nr:hypothetical protein [Halieaceae bacterium]
MYYPSRFTDSIEERSTGVVGPDGSRSPFPVVILLPDEDLTQESYAWLALELAQAGTVAVTYSWICEDDAGQVRSGPGQQRKRLTLKRYGRKPSCPALPAVFTTLKKLNKSGVLASHLNLSCVVLGGHGLGGRMALLNANRDWFPTVCGAFAYGGHALADPEQGWSKRDVLPLETDMSLLLIGGTSDGVMETETAYIAGKEASPTWAVQHSFNRGIQGKRGDRHLVLVEGASHYNFAAPRDPSTGKEFMDRRTRGHGKDVRKYLAQLLVTFCDQTCRGDPMTTADLKALCDSSHPMVAHAEHK